MAGRALRGAATACSASEERGPSKMRRAFLTVCARVRESEVGVPLSPPGSASRRGRVGGGVLALEASVDRAQHLDTLSPSADPPPRYVRALGCRPTAPTRSKPKPSPLASCDGWLSRLARHPRPLADDAETALRSGRLRRRTPCCCD